MHYTAFLFAALLSGCAGGALSTTPIARSNGPADQPVATSVAPRATDHGNGYVYICGYTGGNSETPGCATYDGKTGNLLGGASMPSYYLGDGNATHDADGVAFDAQGDCVITYISTGSSGVGGANEFKGCAQDAKARPIPVVVGPPSWSNIWNPIFDRADNLVYISGDSVGSVYRC